MQRGLSLGCGSEFFSRVQCECRPVQAAMDFRPLRFDADSDHLLQSFHCVNVAAHFLFLSIGAETHVPAASPSC
jgi:hypothetical protein